MKRLNVLILLTTFCFAGACHRQAANADANASNANAETSLDNQFDNITDPDAALAEGNRLMDENQTEPAIAAYRRAIKLNPDLAEAHFKLGIAYSLEEMADIHQGLDLDATRDAKGEPAKMRSEKEFEKAAEAYKKWIDANPKDDLADYNLGRTFAKLNKDDDAEKAFRQAIKLKPDDAEYETELGAVLIKLAKYHEAVDALKKAIDLDDQNARAQELLDDAKAGAQRLDYAGQKPNANQSNANRQPASNANANVSSNSNAGGTPPDRPRVVNQATPQPTRKPGATNRP